MRDGSNLQVLVLLLVLCSLIKLSSLNTLWSSKGCEWKWGLKMESSNWDFWIFRMVSEWLWMQWWVSVQNWYQISEVMIEHFSHLHELTLANFEKQLGAGHAIWPSWAEYTSAPSLLMLDVCSQGGEIEIYSKCLSSIIWYREILIW